MIGYIWEFFVCFYEILLMIYLFSKKNFFHRKSILLYAVYSFFMTAILIFLSLSGYTTNKRLVIMLVCIILCSYFFFGYKQRDKAHHYLLWPCFYVFLTIFSEQLTFSLADMLANYSLNKLLVFGSARIQFTLIYLLVLSLFVWITTHLGKKDSFLPLPVVILVFLLMSIGIFATETIFDIALILHAKPDTYLLSEQLSFVCYAMLIMLFSFFVCFEYLGIIRRKNKVMEQEQQLNDLEKQQYDLMVSATKSLQEWKHDYQGQLKLIVTLIAQDNYKEVKEYTEQLISSLPASRLLLSTGNFAIDAVVSLHMIEAKRETIDFHSAIFLPPSLPLSNVEFSSLINNVLDNAIEACRRVSAPSTIQFEIKPFKQMLFLFCSNTSNGKYRYGAQNSLLSTKEENGHGIGIKRIQQIVEKTGGTCQFTPKPDQFTVHIMIPLEE